MAASIRHAKLVTNSYLFKYSDVLLYPNIRKLINVSLKKLHLSNIVLESGNNSKNKEIAKNLLNDASKNKELIVSQVISEENDMKAFSLLISCQKSIANVTAENIPKYGTTLDIGRKLHGRLQTFARNRNFRERKGQFILDGKDVIKAALEAGVKISSLFFNEENILIGLPLINSEIALYHVDDSDITSWTNNTGKSSGIMAIAKIPVCDEIKSGSNKIPLILICDNIREPGNMGTIIRSAAAVGCKALLCLKGCVDIWEAKVIRTGAGGHFKLPILNNLDWEFVSNSLEPKTNIYLAETCIPDLVSGNKIEEIPDHKDDISHTDLNTSQKFKKQPLTCISYSQVNFCTQPSALVVGGETSGLSDDAYKLFNDRKGCKINIPIVFDMDSLNVAIASSIILFEVKRQFIASQNVT